MGKWNENMTTRGKAAQERDAAAREKRITRIPSRLLPDRRTLRLQQELQDRKAQAKLTSEPGKHIPQKGVK